MLVWNWRGAVPSGHLGPRGFRQESTALRHVAASVGSATEVALPGGYETASMQAWELSWLATVFRPDICARLARIATRIGALQGSDVYRINDLVETAKEC